MKRQDKYPETKSFVFYNANPKGKFTTDCVIRALSDGCGIPYNDVVLQMAAIQCKTGLDMSENRVIDKFLARHGWEKQKQPRKEDNTKYTGKEWCDWLSINYRDAEIGNVICNIGGHHIVAVKPTNHGDGFNCRYKVHDTWDSTDGCVGMWWRKVG